MRIRSNPIHAVLAATLAAVLSTACAPALHNHDAELEYLLSLDPAEGIVVTCTARGLRDRNPEFQLLGDYGMLRDLPGHVEGLEARDGAGRALAVEPRRTSSQGLWRVRRRGADEITLRYRVRSYDPLVSPEATFVEPDRGLALGYSAFVAPTELTDYLPSRIRVRVAAPEGWPVWTSWGDGAGPHAPTTLHRLWSGGAAAGAYRESRLASGPARVVVLTEAHWTSVTGLTIANRLIPALRGMIALFGAPPYAEETLDVLAVYRVAPPNPRQGKLIGVSEENAFFCLATPDRYEDLDELTALAVHECLHFYLGGAILPEPEPPYNNAPDLIWLTEGVTEYLTFRIMAEAGVLSPSAFSEIAVAKRRKMTVLEARGTASMATAARLVHDPETYELIYTRGFFLGALLETWMDGRSGPGAFDGALRDLFVRYDFRRTARWVTPEDVESVFAARTPGADELIRRYGRGAEPLPGSETARANEKRRPGAPL